MNSSKVIAQLRKKIEAAQVTALNQTADRILDDLKANVPIKTGALNQSYQIQERPRKGRLRVVTGTPIFWANFQYPNRSQYKPPRRMDPNRLMPPKQENPYRVIDGNEVDYTRVEKVLQDNFERLMNGD